MPTVNLSLSFVLRQHFVAVCLTSLKQKKNGIEGNNIHPAFRISGLGQLIEAGIQSDRLVVFGD
jgi:sulfur relay (sulfurtransferase) complex TusBCD TusD component (DsrE family)